MFCFSFYFCRSLNASVPHAMGIRLQDLMTSFAQKPSVPQLTLKFTADKEVVPNMQ